MKNKKIIIILSISILIIGLIVTGVIIKLYNNDITESSIDKIYGTVLSYNEGLLNVKTVDNDEITIISNSEYEEGDFILIEYYPVGKDSLTSIELIAEGDELETFVKEEVITTTTTTTTTTKTTKKGKKTSTTTATTNKVLVSNPDDVIINYLTESEDEIDSYENNEKFSNIAKEKIITLIDFIFYDTEINDVKYKDLTESAKAKVIYYVLLIDSKINEVIPDYKEKLDETYTNFKNKLIATYLDLSSKICENNEVQCNYIKEDFQLLKKSINLTWDFIKNCFEYGTKKTTDVLKNWYEIWSGKV